MSAGGGPPEWTARHFDGRTARPHAARVRLDASGLMVVSESGASRLWRFDELRITRGDRRDEPVQIELSGEPVEAVIVEDRGFLTALRLALPPGARVKGAGGMRLTLGVVLGLALALGLMMVLAWRWGIPALAKVAAGHVPVEWESRIGRAVVDELAPSVLRVTDPAVTDPVEAIHARIAGHGTAGAPGSRVLVARLPIVNAFAAPGGTVVVTTRLIQALGGAEELAAVLAHEVAHVALRHPVEGLMTRLSSGALLALIAGDGSALSQAMQVAGELGALSHSRAEEAEADQAAAKLLADAGVSPRALARALDSMGRGGPKGLGASFLSTHPAPAERRAQIERLAARARVRDAEPVLDPEAWSRLLAAVQRAGEP
jgi:predicted Zn-dependent protease